MHVTNHYGQQFLMEQHWLESNFNNQQLHVTSYEEGEKMVFMISFIVIGLCIWALRMGTIFNRSMSSA